MRIVLIHMRSTPTPNQAAALIIHGLRSFTCPPPYSWGAVVYGRQGIGTRAVGQAAICFISPPPTCNESETNLQRNWFLAVAGRIAKRYYINLLRCGGSIG